MPWGYVKQTDINNVSKQEDVTCHTAEIHINLWPFTTHLKGTGQTLFGANLFEKTAKGVCEHVSYPRELLMSWNHIIV